MGSFLYSFIRINNNSDLISCLDASSRASVILPIEQRRHDRLITFIGDLYTKAGEVTDFPYSGCVCSNRAALAISVRLLVCFDQLQFFASISHK